MASNTAHVHDDGSTSIVTIAGTGETAFVTNWNFAQNNKNSTMVQKNVPQVTRGYTPTIPEGTGAPLRSVLNSATTHFMRYNRVKKSWCPWHKKHDYCVGFSHWLIDQGVKFRKERS